MMRQPPKSDSEVEMATRECSDTYVDVIRNPHVGPMGHSGR
jgi:hypothetical protein